MAKTHSDASKKERSRTIRWVVTVFLVTLVVSGMISLISDEVMASSGLLAAFAILLGIVFLGIIFDIIGMAVATANEKPFHSMAARKVPGAQEAIRLMECRDLVAKLLLTLDERSRTVLILRYFQQLDSQQIAQRMGLSPVNVRVIQSRAMEKLRQAMEQMDETEKL